MQTPDQCRADAAQYSLLARDTAISVRRATLLTGISQTLTVLANQLERLAIIIKDESK